jgi:hypothetical protein
MAAVVLVGINGADGAPRSVPKGEPPARFDLDCTLQHMVKRRMLSVRTHLRVDLEQRRWCEDTCETVNELTLLADVATLISRPVTEGPVVTRRTLSINRRSGRMKDERVATLDQDTVMDDVREGVCRLRPYTDIDHKLF